MVAAVGFPTFFIQIYVEFVTNFSDMLVLRISRDFFYHSDRFILD